MKLIHSVAQIVAKIAEREAEKVGVPMAIAIADNNGSMVHFTFMDATLPVSRELAVSKAYTAAVLRMSAWTPTVWNSEHPSRQAHIVWWRFSFV